MAVFRFVRRQTTDPETLTDGALLALFEDQPERAWDVFLDRYAGLVLGTLHHLGFDHDEAMDRFVYVCEKLSEERFRRLRSIRFTGDRGELVPWIRTVVKNLSVSWAWSVDGRKRLFKSIAALPTFEQRVFELYFWRGLTPSEVHEHLKVEEQRGISLVEVLDALERVFDHLTEHQRWRLMSQLIRAREPIAIAPGPEAGVFEPSDPRTDPESWVLRQERQQVVAKALETLAPRERLILQLRYEDALTVNEVAEMLQLSRSTVKASVRTSLGRLRGSVTTQEQPARPGRPGSSP